MPASVILLFALAFVVDYAADGVNVCDNIAGYFIMEVV